MSNTNIYNKAIEMKNSILEMTIEGNGYNPLLLMKKFNLSEYQINKISCLLEGSNGRCKVVNNKLFLLLNVGDYFSYDYRKRLIRKSDIEDVYFPGVQMPSTVEMMALLEKI